MLNENINMEHLIKRLEKSVAFAEKEGENMDDVSWGMQEGILISYNEAKAVIEALKAFKISSKPVLSAGLSTLKGKWVVGNIKGGVQTETIHFQRKGAIAKFLEGSSMTWEECVKCGWIVCKVDIVFQPCR